MSMLAKVIAFIKLGGIYTLVRNSEHRVSPSNNYLHTIKLSTYRMWQGCLNSSGIQMEIVR